MVPGFLDTSWKALDNRAGLEGSDIRGGTAHHEGTCLTSICSEYRGKPATLSRHVGGINRLSPARLSSCLSFLMFSSDLSDI